jgi:hypothetical protein
MLMAREPNWSQQEFEVLLQHSDIPDQKLNVLLPMRSCGAIEVVRDFIHSYHTGGNISGLSIMMKHRLAQKSWVCPRCFYRC